MPYLEHFRLFQEGTQSAEQALWQSKSCSEVGMKGSGVSCTPTPPQGPGLS